MKVKLLTPRVLNTGQTQEFGEIIEVGPDEAARLIRAQQAVVVETPRATPPAHKRR